MTKGNIFLPEISGAEFLPGDRLLIASDEHGLRVVDKAAKQLRGGKVTPRGEGVVTGKLADGFALDDAEDVTTDGDGHVYVVTSHARNRRGAADPLRYRVGRLRFDDDGAATRAEHSDALWWALFSQLPALADAALRTPAQGGLNVEGMAWLPDGDLLVGLRSPTITRAVKRKKKAGKTQEDAVVVRVGNPAKLFDDPGTAVKFVTVAPDARGGKDDDDDADEGDARCGGKVHLLNLRGHGIRGLSYDADRKACWILSNLSVDPNHAVDNTWRLWLWDMKKSPRPIACPAGHGLSNPEAVCLVDVGGEPHLLIIDDAEVHPELIGEDDAVDVERLAAEGAGCPYVLLRTADLEDEDD